MRILRKLFFLITISQASFFFSCNQGSEDESVVHDSSPVENQKYHNSAALVEASELAILIKADTNIQIIDLRPSVEYFSGHIPRAKLVSMSIFNDSQIPGSGLMQDKLLIEEAMRKYGFNNDSRIFIYDDNACCAAARLWWILYVNGFKNTSLLNGGYTAWTAGQFEIDNSVLIPERSTFTFKTDSVPEIINYSDVLKCIEDSNITIVDARSEDEYSGKTLSRETKRPGHIPNSILLDWSNSVNYHDNKKFKNREDLENMFSDAGIIKDKKTITYCRSGVRSAHLKFVMQELLGYKNVQNYDGSWLEWSSIDSLPVEIDQNIYESEEARQ